MKRAKMALETPLPMSFLELNKLHMLRPIQDKVDLENAIETADHLALMKRLNTEQRHYLETLSTLIEEYEREALQITARGAGDAVDVLQELLDAHAMNASDLGRLLGNRQYGAAILRSERQLSKANIKALADHFKVDAGLFL